MFVWNASWNEGNAVNLANLDSIVVQGSGSQWGFQGSNDAGGVAIAPVGTFTTKADAVTALLALLQQVGYVDVS